jgi:glucose-6-phosphate 1-dehydrogenase
MPALFYLYREGLIGENFMIVGFARRPLNNQEFVDDMKQTVMKNSTKNTWDEKKWQQFTRLLHYQQGDFTNRDAYQVLANQLDEYDQKAKLYCNRLYYLATSPVYYETILDQLMATGQTRGARELSPWRRIVIEKPFGKDLETARALDRKLNEIFNESQIYRIDHYLGKETIQNILAFRFANGIFEPIWNRKYVDHIQITFSESGGVGTRGQFYEGVGALRDVAQNHLLMKMAIIAMEQPRHFSSEAVRDMRAKLIKEIRCIGPEQVGTYTVRGQYGSGVIMGQPVIGYRQEKNVSPVSITETFAALKLFVDNQRWQDVPFYLRTGKRLRHDHVEISLVFRQTCHILFREVGCPEEGNVLTIRISPNEGIGIRVITKEPGHTFTLRNVDMDFNYKESFDTEVVEPYERLLEDVLSGEQMLFNRTDELEASWEIITNILNGWEKMPPPFPNYPAGSWGPQESDQLIEKDGRKWVVK